MQKKQRKFADDGWAVWIDGDDISTVYLNDWLNPKGKSFIDLAIRIRGVKVSKSLNIYIEKYKPNYVIRISQRNFGFENGIKSVPLYVFFVLSNLKSKKIWKTV